ncbi:hypothetical protein CLV48_1109 [Cecembia rubra]|uniref:Uncharacterized protein n=1 Tax=Cecembia rubra TaxID=1485585 RepID=A0A2P8DYI1_9BACT|nr:hypothetical protein CLV48_1109 [Cecembia rubra]
MRINTDEKRRFWKKTAMGAKVSLRNKRPERQPIMVLSTKLRFFPCVLGGLKNFKNHNLSRMRDSHSRTHRNLRF